MNTIGTNGLIKETSPCLLLPAPQKIKWHPWGADTFEKAKKEDKLLFISSGYPASHWCQKMSRDCFENESIYELLNAFFISIQVDKEERPDVDRFYVNAVHLVSDKAGWPVSCFALPNGAPIWGGTYFEPAELMDAMLNIEQGYRKTPLRIQEASKELMNALSKADQIDKKRTLCKFTIHDLRLIIEPWRRKFDTIHGGTHSTPKFPLPNSILFLLASGYYLDDISLAQHSQTTLKGILNGGIHDHLGGGFFHYSHDNAWRLPLFEKMIFDNAYIVGLFAIAHRSQILSDPAFAEIIEETIDFLIKEMTAPNGMFYTSILSESEEKEGESYLWRSDELPPLLGNDSPLAIDYFGIKEEGGLRGKNIPYVNKSIKELAEKHQITEEETKEMISSVKQRMLAERNKRVQPQVDKKIITVYNATMMRGLYESYLSLGKPAYLAYVISMADYLIEHLIKDDFRILRIKTDTSEQTGFLEDYALVIYIFCSLHHALDSTVYLDKAIGLTGYALENFFDKQTGMFFFAEQSDSEPPVRSMDLIDKAIPSSNSIMAMNLTLLAAYTGNVEYRDIAHQMLCNIKPHMFGSGPYMAHWARVTLLYTFEPIMAFTTTPGKVKELTMKASLPNLYYCQATPVCLENSGRSHNGWFYYQIDLSGTEEENEAAYNKLSEYAMANRLKGI